MNILRNSLIAIACTMAFAPVSQAAPEWLKGTEQQELHTLADIQPGLGTIMIEYSRRFTAMYYAAKGGNWGMAEYQMKEMPEIQEVGENTRPKFAPMLKAFEQSSLAKLADTVKAKDWKKFEVAFHETAQGCNGCHAANGYGFIRYELPKSSPSPTSNTP
jgi:hypothetical protein